MHANGLPDYYVLFVLTEKTAMRLQIIKSTTTKENSRHAGKTNNLKNIKTGIKNCAQIHRTAHFCDTQIYE